jgi:Xaa-Pro dipeptidase
LDGVDTDVNFTGGYRDRMGYSVGIGFPPDWAEHSVQITRGYMNILQPGMVFHTARSVRLPGIISAAFSETILVTETGCEILTPHRRELVIV